jgi:hypothetical protein
MYDLSNIATDLYDCAIGYMTMPWITIDLYGKKLEIAFF